MTDRNRWDEDRRWKTGNNWRADEDEGYRARYRGAGDGERQSWQQDYSGEMGRHDSHDGRSPRHSQQEGGRYDDRTEFQTSSQRYGGTGYSSYGSAPSASTGDYFGTGDFGSGAHAWDRNSTQAYAGSGRYGSISNPSGYSGELGSMSSYAPGSGDRGSPRQSWQRDYSAGQERGFLERAGDEVMSWFGDEDAARRREADHRGVGPSDYTRSDERIREDVNDRLTDDPRVNARNISVAVENGEVTLNGTVGSREDKRRAEDCVDSISGVKHVQNNLRVDAASGNSSSSYSNWGSGSTSSEAKATGMTTGSDKNTGTAGAALRSDSTTGSTSA